MVLAKREEINKKQNQLAKMMAVDAQNRLKKASAEVTKLTGELKTCKEENAELVTLTNSLQSREKELQQQLNEGKEKNYQQFVYITELQTTLVDTDKVLKEVSDDILKKENELKLRKEREMCLEKTNFSLKQQLEELQEKLNDMNNTQAMERVAIDKELADKSQQIAELSARDAALEKEIKENGRITTQLDKNKGSESELEIMASSLNELQEKLENVMNTHAVEQEEIDRELEEKLQQVVELSCKLSGRNDELEKENKEKEGIATEFENCKEREKELEKINSSLKDQLKEVQAKLDDSADVQNQKSEEVILEQAEKSKQIIDSENEISFSNAALQNFDAHGKKMAELLASCKEEREKIEEACTSLNEITGIVETVDVPEMTADVVNVFNADDYFGAKESPFDFLTNEEVGGRPDSLENALDNNKEQREELEITNSSWKDDPEESQESLDDMANIQTEIRDEATLEQADLSQQFVELHNQMSSSNTAMKNLDVQERKMADLLENCKEQKENLEETCSSLKETAILEIADVSEMCADVSNVFNAEDYFEAKSSPFDDFLANKAEVKEQPVNPGNVRRQRYNMSTKKFKNYWST
ncbi:uncharacterized protein LOC144635427 [Oculina patagonica]